MELRHLRYFVMAAAEQSISRAAARLNISQPGVSRQIRDLEEELGVTLFDRASHGLTLTEPGQTALSHAQEILRRAGDLKLAMDIFNKPTHTLVSSAVWRKDDETKALLTLLSYLDPH